MAGREARHTPESLVREARRAAATVGTGRLTVTQFRRETGISDSSFYRHFESWAELCRAAGVSPVGRRPRIPDAAVFGAMHDAFVAAGGVTGKGAFLRRAKFGNNVIVRRFGGWTGALEALSVWLADNALDAPYADRLAERIAAGRAPALPANAVARAWPSVGVRVCGPPLGWRALLHAPVNEQGVVLAFGMLAETLGYAVEGVGISFPDCLAKRRVGPDRWEGVRIEFEFRSRAFRDHGHDPAKCDLIVCWEHDWPDCPIEVIALADTVERLRRGA